MSGRERGLVASVKCGIKGHDWSYNRKEGERTCRRCLRKEDYEVEETHKDKTASKGERRLRIDDGGVIHYESYTCTAHGPGTEYWQWFPMSKIKVGDDELLSFKEEIERYLDTGSDRDD